MNNRQRQTYHDVLHSIKNNDPTLNGASLQGCNIDDQGAQDLADALQRNTALSVIDLYNNQIGDQGAQALADALQRNTALTEIYLHENQIGDQGAQALAVALQKNTTVTSIYLRANQIGDEGAQALAEALQRNTTVTVIYLDANQILNNSIVNRINELCQRNKVSASFLSTRHLHGCLFGIFGGTILVSVLHALCPPML